jgi:acyl carrier protein
MDEEQIYARLAEIFEDVFDEDTIKITPELSAKDIDGWDSLAQIRLALAIEKAFDIKFSTSEIGNLGNVSYIVKLIRSRTQA